MDSQQDTKLIFISFDMSVGGVLLRLISDCAGCPARALVKLPLFSELLMHMKEVEDHSW